MKRLKEKPLTRDDVVHIAELIKMELTDKEIDRILVQFTETLNYVDNLNELDTSATPTTNQPTQLEDVYFEDGEKNNRQLSIEEVLQNAKHKKDRCFVVERIL